MAAMRKTNQELHRAIQADMKDFLKKNDSGTIQQWAATSEWTRDTVRTHLCVTLRRAVYPALTPLCVGSRAGW